MQKIAFLLSAFLVTNSAYAASASISTQTEVWFSPQGGARDAILESIAGAKKEIHVGAYKLEDKIIAQALVDAKDRGVEVSIILDKKKSKYKTSLKKWLRTTTTGGQHLKWLTSLLLWSTVTAAMRK